MGFDLFLDGLDKVGSRNSNRFLHFTDALLLVNWLLGILTLREASQWISLQYLPVLYFPYPFLDYQISSTCSFYLNRQNAISKESDTQLHPLTD